MKGIHPSLAVAIAALLLLPGLAYFGLRLTLPSDPSSPAVDFLWIQPGELAVQPISPSANGLQNGDIVTAVQGRGVDEYIRGMFSAQRTVAPADRIQYTVLRDGQTLHVEAPLTTPSLLQLVKENWSIYVYLIFLDLVSLLVFILRPRLAAAQLLMNGRAQASVAREFGLSLSAAHLHHGYAKIGHPLGQDLVADDPALGELPARACGTGRQTPSGP